MKDIILKYKKYNPRVGVIDLSKIFGLNVKEVIKLLNINDFIYNGEFLILYDGNGNEVQYESKLNNGKRLYEYDELNRLKYIKLENNVETFIFYGKNYYTVKKKYGDRVIYKIHENETGNLILITSYGGEGYDNYFYDDGNLVYKKRNGKLLETLKYDDDGNLIEVLQENYTLKYSYDFNGNLLSGNQSSGFFDNYTYDKNNNLIKYENSNNFHKFYFYDNNKLIFSIDSNGYIDIYDENGNKNYYTHYKEEGTKVNLIYNKDNKLIFSKRENENWVKYDYDFNGNYLMENW